MTAAQRKSKTELFLNQLDIPVNKGLPIIEEESDARIRTAADIAKRILVLAYLGGYAEGGDRDEITGFLKEEDLWDAVSDNEKALFAQDELSNQDSIDISWKAEAMLVLLWAINKTEIPDLPVAQCDIGAMLDELPGPFEPASEFINNVVVKTAAEILDKSDLIYRLHWAAREAETTGQEIPAHLDTSILQEWHYAINWITFYDENWDDITTDT